VTFGVSQGTTATFDSSAIFRSGGTRLYGLMLFDELRAAEPASEGLAILAGMIASGALRPGLPVRRYLPTVECPARLLIDDSSPPWHARVRVEEQAASML
jgi:hypothetical protein